MPTHNSYFEGTVQSLGFSARDGAATVGVMDAGEYEFGTGAREIMTVIRGTLTVQLPGSDAWQTFESGAAFEVPANSRFKLQVPVQTAYLCEFRED